ncbi:MAG: hypothetical protein OHK0046_10780 [Anaerolineae bacterium]
MSKYKEWVLQEFDQIILELQQLLTEIPDTGMKRVSGNTFVSKSPSQRQIDTFYTLRSRYVQFLSNLPSADTRLQDAIVSARDAEANRENVERLLGKLQGLRSDYSADILDPTNSSTDHKTTAKYLLQEAMLEVQYFQAPFPMPEIDRLAKMIKQAIRFVFGEESSQFKEIDEIFHPTVSVVAWFGDKEYSRQEHLKRWSENRDRLINSLNIALRELNLIQVENSEVYLESALDSNSKDMEKPQMNEPRAIIYGSFINGVFLLIATLVGSILGLVLAPIIQDNDRNEVSTITPSALYENVPHTSSSPENTQEPVPTLTIQP